MKSIIIALLATVLFSTSSFALNYQTAPIEQIVSVSISALAAYAPSCATAKEYRDHIEYVYSIIYDEVLQNGYYPTLEMVANLDIGTDKEEYRALITAMAGTVMRAKKSTKERQQRLFGELALYIHRQVDKGRTAKELVKEYLKSQRKTAA